MIETRGEAREKCAEYGIPDHMWHAVEQWVIDHELHGDFFKALVDNDLSEAIGRADEMNLIAIGQWSKLLYNEFPTPAWGSPEKVKAWIESGEDQADE